MGVEEAIQKAVSSNPKETKSLSFYRTFNGLNGGLEVMKDTLEFNGDSYIIVKIEPENVWRNMPNQFRLILRRQAASNH